MLDVRETLEKFPNYKTSFLWCLHFLVREVNSPWNTWYRIPFLSTGKWAVSPWKSLANWGACVGKLLFGSREAAGSLHFWKSWAKTNIFPWQLPCMRKGGEAGSQLNCRKVHCAFAYMKGLHLSAWGCLRIDWLLMMVRVHLKAIN